MRSWQNEISNQKQVLLLHEALVKEFSGGNGIREEGLLESALSAPMQTFGGEEIYPSLLMKAAQLGFGLICNHAFIDGNKRIGAHAMLVFLAINGVELCYKQEELIEIILSVASGKTDNHGLFEWIVQHQK